MSTPPVIQLHKAVTTLAPVRNFIAVIVRVAVIKCNKCVVPQQTKRKTYVRFL